MKVLSAAIKAIGLPLVHLIPLTLFWTGTTLRDWALFALTYMIVVLTVGGGLHRYFAHKAFQTSRAFQFIIGLLAGAVFGDPIEFTAKHRWHHRYSDRDDDVHSPGQGVWQCWIGHILENRLSESEMFRLAPDLVRYPELVWLHRYWFVPGAAACSLFLAFGGYRAFACAYCLGFMVALHGPSAINFFCHKGRKRNFETKDVSSNSMILAVLLLGEGWHNNHHHYPASARSGIAWYEFDFIYWTVKGLALFGIVWAVREIPLSVRMERGKLAGAASCALQ